MAKPPQSSLKKHQKTLLIAGIASVALWAIPLANLLLLPVQYLNTHLHELCHAVMGMLTGGQVGSIAVYADGSGKALIAGGSLVLTASAGYPGAAILGGLMVAFATDDKAAGKVLKTVAITLAVSMLLWVRGDLVGLATGVFWIAALWIASNKLRGDAVVFTAQFLGLQQALSAFQSLYTLLQLSTLGGHVTDAEILARATGIPPIVWAGLWTVFGVFAVAVALRASWAGARRRPAG